MHALASRHAFQTLSRRFALLTATLAAGVSLAASAQDTPSRLHRVQVNGQTVMAPERFDVRTACIAPDRELVVPLEAALARERLSDELRVSFVLSEGRISSVRAHGSQHVYDSAVKRAVLNMHCSDAAATQTPQLFAFKLALIGPHDDPRRGADMQAAAQTDYRVAVLSR